MIIQNILGCSLCIASAALIGRTNDKQNYIITLKKNWKSVIFGLLFLLLTAYLFTHSHLAIKIINLNSKGLDKLKDAAIEGSKFVFGYLGGGDTPFQMTPGKSAFIFAFQTLPSMIVISVISTILTYTGALRVIAKIFGKLFSAVFNISNALGMVSLLKVFLGQLEAPIVIKSQLETLTKFEITVLLSLAFSTTSAAVIPMYSILLEPKIPNAMDHFIIANVLNVVATLLLCRIVLPTIDNSTTSTSQELHPEKPYKNFADAIARGLSDGSAAWWSIVGALVGMVALVYVINLIFDLLPAVNGSPLTLQRCLSVFMYPFAWLCGFDSKDIGEIALLLSTKLAANETIAFFDLAKANLEPKSIIQSIYLLNNFGNLSCVGITINGMLAMAPHQRYITEQIWQGFGIGFLSSLMTTSLMGVFL